MYLAAFTSRPGATRSAVAVSVWPPAAACMSAVKPSSFSAAFTGEARSGQKRRDRHGVTSARLLPAARMSAVPPSPFAAFTSMPGAASSAVTVSVWPLAAACMSAVMS